MTFMKFGDPGNVQIASNAASRTSRLLCWSAMTMASPKGGMMAMLLLSNAS